MDRDDRKAFTGGTGIWAVLLPALVAAILPAACGKDGDKVLDGDGDDRMRFTASGTYTYDPGNRTITLNVTSSDFQCKGPDVGTTTAVVESLTSTTMVVLFDDGRQRQTWTRDGGQAGDIVGRWESWDEETGDWWEVEFAPDGSFTVVGRIVECDEDTYDVDKNGIPRFIGSDYIELDKIRRISRFRSGIGHDYSDDFESCRSMKHYFQPGNVDWATIAITSPVSGTVTKKRQEWAGTQVHIKSSAYPAFYFILFHVALDGSLNVGDTVTAGQRLGAHVGSQTMSDIAVGVNTPDGWKLLSYFDVMTDSLFESYRARGLDSRSDAIISKEARDADPLQCDGEEFLGSGNLENWVTLD